MKTWALVLKALESHGRCALVSVVETEGSAPRDAGARLVVTPEGFHGTIGGGSLEWRAIAGAQSLLDRGAGVKFASHALGPDLGQCCGGRVRLATEIFDASNLPAVRGLAAREAQGRFTVKGRIASLDIVESFGDDNRRLYLFGAGHVGKALVLALAPLPFDVHWIDSRPGAFPGAVPRNVTLRDNADLAEAPGGSLVYIMSHSHALDLAIAVEALRNPRVTHVGLIGSATKRARFVKRLREAQVAEARIEGIICPIGVAGIRSKEPAAIAAATAAQLILLDEGLRAALPAEETRQRGAA